MNSLQNMKKKNSSIDVWVFIALLFILTSAIGWLWRSRVNIPLSAIPIFTGLLGFSFWMVVYRKPIAEIYSSGYPYRKLGIWGIILSIASFEYLLVWGLHTKQIQLADQHLYSLTVVFAGAIAFYFSFVRMRVSLRFLFLGIFIPVLALGSAIGFGRYFGFIQFIAPQQALLKIVFLNTSYWVIFGILYQLICEEPAFRGFLMQRLMDKGAAVAIIISSIIYGMWHVIIDVFEGTNIFQGIVSFAENFIVGCLLALLFIKGKNLLISAISNGIIKGLKLSLLAADKHVGISQYIKIATTADSESKFIILWFLCLFIGLLVVLITPQKRRPQTVFKKISVFVLSFLIFFNIAGSAISQPAGGERAMGKRAVFIIAKDGFRDEELQEPKAVLEKGGVKVVLASSSSGTATGMLGGKVEVEKTIDEIDPQDYDAVVFIGGGGSSEYWDNPAAHSIAKRAYQQGKLVCAICIAPVTLANAGLLIGKKATVWSSEAGALKKAGAVYTAKPVEIDGNIITASGPTAAKEFGKAILERLK